MINEQYEKRESEENNDHDGSVIDQKSLTHSIPKDLTTGERESENDLKKKSISDDIVPQRLRNILDPFPTNSDVKEIREIVQTIAKAVFRIIDNNFDQLANRSSNTFGMRVKDSLILKVQQTNRKQIPFDELKTSLVCRLIVDDDHQTPFSPRIESPAPSTRSENLSTKQKKSVSLAEEVEVFNRVENDFFFENEVGFFNELMDTQNDRIMEQQKNHENDDKMSDFTSQKTSSSPAENESLFFKKFENDLQTSESRISSKDLSKFDNSRENPMLSENANLISDGDELLQKIQTTEDSAHDRVLGVRNLPIASAPNVNQMIKESKQMSNRSKTVNEDSDESTVFGKKQKRPLVLNVDVEIKFKEEETTSQRAKRSKSKNSKINNLYADNPNYDFDENSSTIDVPNSEDMRKKLSKKNTRSKRNRENTDSGIETFDIRNKTAIGEKSNEERKRTKVIKKFIDDFFHTNKKTTAGDNSKGEDQEHQRNLQPTRSFKNPEQLSSTTINLVSIDSASAKIDPSHLILESGNEDKISEKEILGAERGTEKLQNCENTLTPEAQFEFTRLSEVDQNINDREISEEKEQPESLSESKPVDKCERAGNENVRSSKDKGDKGLYKLFKKTFATANVEIGNIVKLPITSLVQKHTSKNKNVKDVAATQDVNSDHTENRSETNQGEEITNERNNCDTHSTNSELKEGPESKSSYTIIVKKRKSTDENISLVGKFPDSSSESEGLNHDVTKATESEEIVTNPEKRSSLFSRMIRSKTRGDKNIAVKKTQSKSSKIVDQVLDDFQRLHSPKNSKMSLKDASKILLAGETSEMDKVRGKDSNTLSRIKSHQERELTMSYEELRTESTSERKISGRTNSSFLEKTFSKVSLKATELSKKPSKTDNSTDQQSTNDPPLKETSSKVSRKVNKSSGKLSKTDISGTIKPGLNNPAIETSLVFSKDGNLSNEIDELQVANTTASRNELELIKKLKSGKMRSASSLKKVAAQVYPVVIDNILQSDPLGKAQGLVDTEVSQQQNLTDEIDEVKIKLNRSRWSLLSKKSSLKLKRDEQEISERESLGNDREDLTKESISRKKSMLHVVSKFSLEGNDPDVKASNLQPGDDRDIIENRSSKSFLSFRAEKPEKNKFLEGFKRNLQSKKSRSKKSNGKSETILKVSSESQTNMDEELASESPELLDNKFGQSSTMINENILTDGKEAAECLLPKDDEATYPKLKSRSFKRFFKRSPKDEIKVEITNSVENVIQKSVSEVSDKFAEELAKNLMEVYSVAVDSDSKINDLSSRLDHSQDLDEKKSCNVNESDKKFIPNELELIPQSSEHLESKPGQTGKAKVNKSFARLLQKMSSKNASRQRSKNSLNDDELPGSKNAINKSKREEKSPKSTKSKQNESKKEGKSSEENAAKDEEDFSRKSHEAIESEEADLKNRTDRTMAQNSAPVFIEKPDSVVLAYLQVKPSVQDQPEAQTIIEDELQSRNLIRQAKEKHSLLSNIKSVFKSSHKSVPQKHSLVSIEDPEKTALLVNKSLHSLRRKKLEASRSEVEVDKEESVDLMRESKEMSIIQSMKSLQDNRKRTKSKIRPGHKLFDHEDISFVSEKHVDKSYQATTQSDFLRREYEEKNEDVEVDGKANSSEESVSESKSQILPRDEEEVEGKTSKVFESGKNSEKKQSPEGNTRKFAISLSRIFSNPSRNRNSVKKSKATANSQTNPEDHFEITKIPLSSSDDSNSQGNYCNITNQKSDATDLDNREELVAIKSLDSMDDSGNHSANKESSAKCSSKVFGTKYASKSSNDKLLRPEQSGTIIFTAPMEVNLVTSENEFEKRNSSNNVKEIRKPLEKIYVTKGTIVSYAPMVESAKYISDERDDRSNEDEQYENRAKRSSGKNFATIRKLFSRASIRSRQDHVALENHSVDEEDHEARKKTLNLRKSSIINYRRGKDRSDDQLNDQAKRESVISATISPTRSVNNDADKNEKQKSFSGIKKQMSKFRLKNQKPGSTGNVESPVNRSGSIPMPTKSNEADIAVNRVELNHGGSEPTEIVAHVSLDDIVIPSASHMDLNNRIDAVKQKLSQRSSHTKKGSLMSVARSFIKRHSKIEKEELEDVKQQGADEKSCTQDSITLSIKDSKENLKGEDVPKTESVFSKNSKKWFKKRSSAVDSVSSNNYVEDPANDLHQSLDIETLPHLPVNGSTDVMTELEKRESREDGTKETSDEIQFAVYSANSETKYSAGFKGSCERLESWKNDDLETSKSKSRISLLKNIAKKSVDALSKASKSNKRSTSKSESTNKDTEIESFVALANSETHIATSFPTQDNPEIETPVTQNENVAQNRSRSKISSKDFRLNPSFASRRSTVVMMATPDPPRREQQTEDSSNSNHQRDESSNSPTAFYYLLGPSLDEALVDVRVVFQNLIDKITGRGR